MAKRKARTAKRSTKTSVVSSKQLDAFIIKHAPGADNWQALANKIRGELRLDVNAHSVGRRGNRLDVKTKGLRIDDRVDLVQSPSLLLPNTDVAKRTLAVLKKLTEPRSLSAIADLVDASPSRVKGALKELKDHGYNVSDVQSDVVLSRILPRAKPVKIDLSKLKGNKVKFGLTADNHLCSRYERLDVLDSLFSIWEEEGIKDVYQLGNMIDGDKQGINIHDVHCLGLEAQSLYCAEHWPQRKGMTTHFITGDDHEGWYTQREGIDVGTFMESKFRNAGRKDVNYLGHMEYDLMFEGEKQTSVMRLIHAGGGSSYATSYSVQKIVESYQGGEKPHVLLVGHYHKAEYGYPREVHVVQAGCTCDQTPFMRKKKLQAHVGGWIIEMTINDDGTITRFKNEFIPFFDKGFYASAWKYQGATRTPRYRKAA